MVKSGLGLSYLDFCHRALSEETLSHNPVEKSGESSVVVMDSPWRCPTRGGFGPVAFDSPPAYLSTRIAQKLPNLPPGEEPSIVRPAFSFRIPEGTAQYAFVVGYSVGTTTLRLMGEEAPFGEGPERCPRRRLEFGIQCHCLICEPAPGGLCALLPICSDLGPSRDHVR